MRRAALCLIVLLSAAPPHASGRRQQQQQPTPQEALNKAIELLQERGLMDQALLQLKVAERLAEKIDKRAAAEITYRMAEVYRELSNWGEFKRMLSKARGYAVGTDLEQTMAVGYEIGHAQAITPLRDEVLVPLLLQLATADELIPKISSNNERLSMLSQSLNVRIQRYVELAETLKKNLNEEQAKSIRAAQMTPAWQIFLTSALRGVPPSAQSAAPEALARDMAQQDLDWLDGQRPWDKVLLQAALALNEKVIEVDRERARLLKQDASYQPGEADKLAELEEAKNLDQQSDIYQLLGDTERALSIKRRQLATFDRHEQFKDAVVVLQRIRDIHLQDYVRRRDPQSLQQALETSSDFVFRFERQTMGLAGQSLDTFLPHGDYELHLQMILELYRLLRGGASPHVGVVLERLLLQADRMNFRPTRRDMAVYQEVGESIGSNPAIVSEFERLKALVVQRRREQERAVALGKSEEDFAATPEDSPFRALEEAKRQLVTALEDFKRENVGSSRTRVQLPSGLGEVTRGMTTADAIVLYLKDRGEGRFLAAVLRAEAPPRLVELPPISDEKLRALVEQMYDQFAVLDPSPEALKQLGDIFWQPLGQLPENLTIVLTPDVIGIPFEALRAGGGTPVVSRHNVRYAFGLAPNLSRVFKVGVNRRALVAGAEKFPGRDLDSLDAKREVALVREQLRRRGYDVTPGEAEALPNEGRPLLARRGEFDILHVSTHGVLNSSVPMFDSLAFPADDVYAFDLALSHARARLLVLSACALFENRESSSNPVSGITTAALARISPQVVSTLWRVDAEATQIFMLRFYDALLKTNDPSAALAVTKRDFVDTTRLGEWLKANNITAPANLSSYGAPHFWAPFVLTVGTMDAPN